MLALDLLGPVRLRRDGERLPLTVRKTAALLVLAALAGPLTRARLVEWLWPALDETTGRRNLRRELARLRDLGAGDALLTAEDRVALAPSLVLDLAAAADSPTSLRATWRGPLAEGLQLDDAPAFMDWLAGERERWRGRWRDALAAEAAAADAAGDAARALAALEPLLADEPLQESHQRAAMRALASLGRREEALARFRDWRAQLLGELGLVPAGETEALAASLHADAPHGGAAARQLDRPAPAARRRGLPLHWPNQLPFVGREVEVARLERAWREGATVLLEGEGGVGKSRLAVDFMAAHGPYARVRCQPADAELPLASIARALGLLAGPEPSLRGLPAWVPAELSRLLPQLGPPPPPLRSAPERERFGDAVALAWRHWGAGNFDAVVLDDWHLADAASQAFLPRLLARRDDGGAPLREWLLYRPVLATEAAARLARLADAGAVRLRLEPLGEPAVYELLQRLASAARPERFARRLWAATGGHPLHLEETLRHLVEQGVVVAGEDGVWRSRFDDDTDDYRELPLPASVRDAVLARVGRLAEPARRVLYAAALADEPFDAALLAPACALDEVECALALEQALEATLLCERENGGLGFVHDLVPQSLAAAMAPARRRLVHRRLALGAQAAGAAPARVAAHFEAGGEPRRALPWRLRAADAAWRLLALDEAIAHWRQARADAGEPPDAEVALTIGRGLVRALDWRGDFDAARDEALALLALVQGGSGTAGARADALIAAAGVLASRDDNTRALAELERLPNGLAPSQQAAAARVRADALRGLGRIADSEAAAAAGLAVPGLADVERAALHDALTMSALAGGRLHAALAHVEAALAASRDAGDRWGEVRAAVRRAALLAQVGDSALAEQALRAAADDAGRAGMTAHQRGTLFNLCVLYAAQSRPADVLAVAQACWAIPPPLPREALRTQLELAFVEAHGALGQLGDAWHWLQLALDDALAIGQIAGLAGAVLAGLELLTLLGETARAGPLLAALDGAAEAAHFVGEMGLVRAECALLDRDRAAATDLLDALPGASEVPRVRVREAIVRAALLLAEGHPAQALAALPADDAPGHNDELRWRALAVRLDAERVGPGVSDETLGRARMALPREGVHAIALWLLHRSVARADAAEAPALAARTAALAASLASYPAQRAAFEARWAERLPV